MSVEQEEPVEVPVSPSERTGMMESLRRVMLASMGFLALTKEELEDFIEKMVERGEIAEQEGKKLINELAEKRRKKAGEAQEMATNQMREILDRMEIPTKTDIDALSAQIGVLTKKVDELRKAQKPSPPPSTGA